MKLPRPLSLLLALSGCCADVWAQSPLESAVAFAKAKRYEEASRELRQVAEPPGTAQRIAFHRLKAAVASGLNQPEEAAAEMERALALAPSEPSLLFATAIGELAAGHVDRAVAVYRGAITRAPLEPEYPRAFGFELIRRQAFRTAIEVLQTALPQHPASTPLRTLLGIAQFATGDVEDSVATLSEAIARDAHAEPAYQSLAQIVLQSSSAPDERVTGQLCAWNRVVCSALQLRIAREKDDPSLMKAAIAVLQQARGTDSMAPCELARAWEWMNRIAEARADMETCVALDPSPRNHYRLGLIYQLLGLTSLAHEQMELRRHLLDGLPEQAANGLSVLSGGATGQGVN